MSAGNVGTTAQLTDTFQPAAWKWYSKASYFHRASTLPGSLRFQILSTVFVIAFIGFILSTYDYIFNSLFSSRAQRQTFRKELSFPYYIDKFIFVFCSERRGCCVTLSMVIFEKWGFYYVYTFNNHDLYGFYQLRASGFFARFRMARYVSDP